MPCKLGRLLLVVLFSAATHRTVQTQQPRDTPGPAFETASIRPSQLEPGCYSILPPGGKQYAVTCLPLRVLIAMAWKVYPDNIQGGDGKALGTYYDVRATVPDGQLWTNDTIPPMLRQLLIDRFHVEVHRGTKQISGYGLYLAKGGSKLKPSDFDATKLGIKAGEGFQNYIIPGSVHGRGVNLAAIASLLSSPAHAVVVDRTGISGVFNVDLHYTYEGAGASDLPDFFTAVEEQLGLKLEPEKITVDTLVIDHVDSEPTPN
jgi:uncharacterized protein (TIGR03435 family)